MLAAGGLATLVRLTSAPAAELRVNAAWALQNLMHHASPDVRAAVLAALPWERVEALATDADARVQVGSRLLTSTATFWPACSCEACPDSCRGCCMHSRCACHC